ncbi:hypothetical protein ACP4OV_026787 [Aristida adscensionis]
MKDWTGPAPQAEAHVKAVKTVAVHGWRGPRVPRPYRYVHSLPPLPPLPQPHRRSSSSSRPLLTLHLSRPPQPRPRPRPRCLLCSPPRATQGRRISFVPGRELQRAGSSSPRRRLLPVLRRDLGVCARSPRTGNAEAIFLRGSPGADRRWQSNGGRSGERRHGVMKPVLSKLADLLKGQYAKHKGIRKKIKFLHDELSAVTATLETLEMLADEGQLSPQDREWRDALRELSYDVEDCIDAFKTRVDHEHDGRNGFKQLVDKLKKLIPFHKTANEIQELQIRVKEISERHNRYKIDQLPLRSSTPFVDPRLSALHEDVENLGRAPPE